MSQFDTCAYCGDQFPAGADNTFAGEPCCGACLARFKPTRLMTADEGCAALLNKQRRCTAATIVGGVVAAIGLCVLRFGAGSLPMGATTAGIAAIVAGVVVMAAGSRARRRCGRQMMRILERRKSV